ncbi:receptor L domain protein [Ancylostoma caninum]|uniref:Receptor L domain protein n=1 Tax=Ancylostoma caninum TaxID=29170 RepID=A0A368H4B0_ANCCA|nr:receptor L domain protein [Ancylostoma caninum]
MDRKLSGKSCAFDDYIVNSVTITSLFPETGFCDTVSGSVRIDETTNLTHQQLTDAFGRVGLVMGKVEIMNTAFTNLSFFSDLYAVMGIVMDPGYSLVIMNNLKLETMNGALLQTYPNARIEGNPLLDPNCTHMYLYYTTKRRVRKNRLNCGCELDGPLTNANIHEVDDNCYLILDVQHEEFEDRVCRVGIVTDLTVLPDNCHTLVGDLTIGDQSRTEDFWKLYNVTRLYGGLTIRNSSLRSFAPLWQLREIHNFAENQSALVIDSNPVLRSAYLGGMMRMLSYLPCSVMENPALSVSEQDCGLFSKFTSDRAKFRGNKDDCQDTKRDSSGFIAEYIIIPVLSLTLHWESFTV